MQLKLLFIIGTRPEAIKLAPVIRKFREYPDLCKVKVCVTAQHREMLDQVLQFFEVTPDYDMNLMQPDQSLFGFTSKALKGLEEVLNHAVPDLIFVQGDTTTAFVGALAGFYKKIAVAHVEAGLRSLNKYAPFPEEINRILADHVCDFHFAPTQRAMQNLLREGINENVHVVGNTVVDALFLTLKLIEQKGEAPYMERFSFLNFDKKIMLVTAHRRESFGAPFRRICEALKEIALNFKDVEVVYPVHLNPNVRNEVFPLLEGIHNIHLIDPLDYPSMVWLMSKAYLVITDSGGIQEEAPSLGKPVLIVREVTERVEGIEAGTARLVGTDKDKIFEAVKALLMNPADYHEMAKAANPYGDGRASERILKILRNGF